MRTLTVIIFVSMIATIPLLSQCMQTHANTLFSAKQLIAFMGSVESGEEVLLGYDFCFKGTTLSESKKHTYYKYRLDHSLNSNTNKYAFDTFFIVEDVNRVEYSTSSNRNFVAYKSKMKKFGFTKLDDDLYSKQIGNKHYYMSVDRSVHKPSGTPNYYINIYSF